MMFQPFHLRTVIQTSNDVQLKVLLLQPFHLRTVIQAPNDVQLKVLLLQPFHLRTAIQIPNDGKLKVLFQPFHLRTVIQAPIIIIITTFRYSSSFCKYKKAAEKLIARECAKACLLSTCGT